MKMRILTTEGVRDVNLRLFSDRSTVGSHWNAVQAFLYGEPHDISRFRGVSVAGFQLLTDLDEIERQAWIGELDLDDIYEVPR
jgi:hypothetical protein